MPLLVMFLFGIIQYGYGLFQYQAFSSAMNDASRVVATGVSSCDQLRGLAGDLVGDNGLPITPDHPLDISVSWLGPDGATESAVPVRMGYAEVTGTYTNPLNFNVPMIPFPDRFTITKRVLVQDMPGQDVVTGVLDLTTCPQLTARP